MCFAYSRRLAVLSRSSFSWSRLNFIAHNSNYRAGHFSLFFPLFKAPASIFYIASSRCSVSTIELERIRGDHFSLGYPSLSFCGHFFKDKAFLVRYKYLLSSSSAPDPLIFEPELFNHSLFNTGVFFLQVFTLCQAFTWKLLRNLILTISNFNWLAFQTLTN